MSTYKLRDLYHITLETGDVAMVPASHVQPRTAKIMAALLRQLAQSGVADIPIPGRWRVMAGADPGRCLSATVQAQIGGDGGEWIDVVWMGVAKHSRCGARLWEAMHDIEGPGWLPPAKTDRATQPVTPWLASRMMAGAVLVPRTELGWLADFEECLAWTWIQERR